MISVFHQYVSSRAFLLVMMEGTLMIVAPFIAAWIRFWGNQADFESYFVLPDFAWQAVLFAVVFQTCFYWGGLYNLHAIRSTGQQLITLLHCLSASCVLLGTLYILFPFLLIGRGVFFISITLVIGFSTISRVTLQTIWQAAVPKQTVAILGTGPLALDVARELKRRTDLPIRMAGFLTTPEDAPRTLNRDAVLGTVDELDRVIADHQITRIIIAITESRACLPVRSLVSQRVRGIKIEDAHSTLASLTGRIWLDGVPSNWFLYSTGFSRSKPTLFLKRVIDITFGALGILLSAPVMVALAMAIRIESTGPVLFRQTRVGKGNRPFELLKFRSMRIDSEKSGAQWSQKDDPRVTRIGGFMRKHRFDELPQFINILRGDMSFVGPRPERPEFVEELRKQISFYDERHSVRPGLTGWAQVSYSYGGTVEAAARKLEYDLFYLLNMSPVFDLIVILKTVSTVVGGIDY